MNRGNVKSISAVLIDLIYELDELRVARTVTRKYIPFYKTRIKRKINKARNMMYRVVKLPKYYPQDIIDVCQFLSNASMNEFISNDDTSFNVSSYLVIGVITTKTTGLTTEFKAYIDTLLDKSDEGHIEIKWDLEENDTIKSYSTSVHIIDMEHTKVRTKEQMLLLQAYPLLKNTFIIHIENVIDSIKERYLQ